MTYPLQENADEVFTNRILRPEPEMQAIFTEIGLRTCGRCAFSLPAGGGRKADMTGKAGRADAFSFTVSSE